MIAKRPPEGGLFAYFFSIFIAATRSISFFVPTFSKSTSIRKSPPIGVILTSLPWPKALCRTLSPTAKLAAGAAFFCGGAGAWAGAFTGGAF